jgi:hypothetical protein
VANELVILKPRLKESFTVSSGPQSSFEFEETKTLAKQIEYYRLISQFIRTLKGRDSLNTVALKAFLEPIKASNNHFAKVYLFNFFSRFALLVKEHAESGIISNLDESIHYGSLLYKSRKE